MQAFAGSIEDPMDPDVKKSLETAFLSVSRLTSWADKVLVTGEVEEAESALENVIEPVRKSVIVVVNLIAGRIGHKNLTRGNSLPDITSESPEPPASGYALSLSTESVLDATATKPPLLPKISLCASESAPPLPPKHLKPRLDRRALDDLISRSYSFHHGDILSAADYYGFARATRLTPHYGLSAANKSLPVPEGLDTTLLDNSFDFNDHADSPYNLSKESVNNISFDDVDSAGGACKASTSSGLASRSWSSRDRSNASSPSLESFGSHLSDTTMERDNAPPPPALPRKLREGQPGRAAAVNGHYPSLGHHQPRRKLSEYDNVMSPERTLDQLSRLGLDDVGWRTPTSTPTSTWSRLAESRQPYLDRPPPLPPKKRNVMSYMEMFGKSILPTGEDILHGFFQTQDLLHNVWQDNFHEYTEYAPTGLLNFPLAMEARGGGPTVGTTVTQQCVNQPTLGRDLPPALPPKKSRSRPGSFRSSLASEERTIPIIREDSGIRMSQASDNSMSSTSSSETPKMAEITKLKRLSVSIPIERVGLSSGQPALDKHGTIHDTSVLDSDDVSSLLVYGASNDKASSGSGNTGGTAELRAGTVDALVILATQTIKNDFLYQEAFLTTYRTFVSTEVLVDKLVYRYRHFGELAVTGARSEPLHRRASRAAFSLLVRVVDGLAEVDFQNKDLLEKLTKVLFLTRFLCPCVQN